MRSGLLEAVRLEPPPAAPITRHALARMDGGGTTRQHWQILLVTGMGYFFAEFGPNATTFVYPAEIFPVRVRATCHGDARLVPA